MEQVRCIIFKAMVACAMCIYIYIYVCVCVCVCVCTSLVHENKRFTPYCLLKLTAPVSFKDFIYMSAAYASAFRQHERIRKSTA